MCVIIDICCLSRVFDKTNKEHADFAPILKWLTPPGKGNMIYGGSTYQRELGESARYIRFINQLRTAGRAIKLIDADVDRIQTAVQKKINDARCDDYHLIAMVIASRCCVVCTCDIRAIPYLTNTALYRDYHMKRPRIYMSKSNKALCSDRHIVGVCRRRKA